MSIHPTALVDSAAKIGPNVSVGPFTIIHGNVEIGRDSVIGSHCEIGVRAVANHAPLVIGAEAHIRSHSVFYEGSRFGVGLSTGHGVVVRDGTTAGDGLQIGRGGDIQGDCSFGDYTRMQSYVAVGKGSLVGSFVWLFPRVSILNDPMPPSNLVVSARVEDWSVVCSHSIIMPGAKVGVGAFVGVNSVVRALAPAERISCGDPLIDKGPTSRLRVPGTRKAARPWTQHFTRGYPEELVSIWQGKADHLAA